MDTAVRDHIRDSAGAAEPAAPGCLAACRPFELRDVAGRQARSQRRHRVREGRRVAADFPATTTYLVFLEPVSVLFERHRRDHGLSNLGALDAGPSVVAAAGTVHVRHYRYVPGVGHKGCPQECGHGTHECVRYGESSRRMAGIKHNCNAMYYL